MNLCFPWGLPPLMSCTAIWISSGRRIQIDGPACACFLYMFVWKQDGVGVSRSPVRIQIQEVFL